jgi:hypothetical protein
MKVNQTSKEIFRFDQIQKSNQCHPSIKEDFLTIPIFPYFDGSISVQKENPLSEMFLVHQKKKKKKKCESKIEF